MLTTPLDEKVVVSAFVPTRLRDELRRIADEEDRSVSAELRRVIERHVLAHEQQEEA